MKVVGILNITEDSFSDGSLYIKTESAISHADTLISQGADVIDIGAQSSNINSKLIDPKEEWDRILPVLDHLQSKNIKVSIDTFKPYVIQQSISKNVDFINNINAFQEPEVMELLSEYKSDLPQLVLMFSHSRGGIAKKESLLQPQSILDEISRFFDKQISKLLSIGVPYENLIFDPGMGFFLGENPDLSFRVLAGVQTLKQRFQRIYVSVSKKSFLGTVLGGIPPSEREYATLAAEIYLYQSKIDWIRTHNPLKINHSIKILEWINRGQ